jgi:hypothetical protein
MLNLQPNQKLRLAGFWEFGSRNAQRPLLVTLPFIANFGWEAHIINSPI